MLPNDWEKSAGILLRDNLRLSKCWSMADIHHAPAVVLKDEVYQVTTDNTVVLPWVCIEIVIHRFGLSHQGHPASEEHPG